MKVKRAVKQNPDTGTVVIVAAAVVGVAAVGGLAWYLSSRNNGSSGGGPPPMGSGSDGNPGGSSGSTYGGSSGTCTTASDCDPCYGCINGYCGKQIPTLVVQTQDLTSYTQDVVTLAVGIPLIPGAAICSGAWYFYNNGVQSNGNMFNGGGKVIDANGDGVPCVTVYLSSTNSAIGLYQSSVVTDSNGEFEFNFADTDPHAGGAPCTVGTSNGQVKGTINANIGGTNITIPFPVDIAISFSGAGI